MAAPRNTVFDVSASSQRLNAEREREREREREQHQRQRRTGSETDFNDYQDEIYTLSIQRVPRPPP